MDGDDNDKVGMRNIAIEEEDADVLNKLARHAHVLAAHAGEGTLGSHVVRRMIEGRWNPRSPVGALDLVRHLEDSFRGLDASQVATLVDHVDHLIGSDGWEDTAEGIDRPEEVAFLKRTIELARDAAGE